MTTQDFSDTSALAPISEDLAVAASLDAADSPELPADRFLDRELSWLAFNQRVLELSEDPGLPLLDQTKFLAIFASNLDEFFMVRVAGLKRRIATGIAVRAASGNTPREVLEAIWSRAYELQRRQAEIFSEEIRPRLEAADISVLRWEELTPAEKTEMDRFFDDKVFPILTPLAVDPSHPFPYISGLSLNLAVV
ncbi:MAG TPA: RNA degradosome polyphosphate kinase, partial [Candidatus Nanopelagicales bacterium]|nr:RNA degradosome polyphosphate kinase [Candidatus Nanopelagicales bacterium]